MQRIKPNGSKIAELRKEKGLKQLAFAKDVGLSESTLRKVETKDYPITNKTIQEIANKLGADAAQLVHVGTTAKLPKRDDLSIELRMTNSVELIEKFRGTDILHYETHIDITKGMIEPIESILRTANLFIQMWTDGPALVEDLPREWREFPEIRAAAEVTESLQTLKDQGVAVLANSLIERSADRREKHLYLSFEKLGVTSRIVLLTVPF
jgi:transcriptional regulator with XRE-family HTH domain